METSGSGRSPAVVRRRWWLCGLLCLATALSFLDRQVLSVLAPAVTEQLGISDSQYGYISTAFLVSYSVMFLLGGRLLDALGTRLGLALSVGLWSLASGLHAAVQSGAQLGAARLLLGMGEGGCFPGAAKGVAEWFDARERALATGVAIGGASIGAVLAPPMTVWLAERVTWRGVFVVTAVIGAAWVVAWWLSVPSAAAREPSQADPREAHPAATEKPHAERLTVLAGRLDVWGLALMRFLFDPVFYFYMFWIPKYLAAERGLSLERIGALSWIPFLALGVSNVIGGWASDRLTRWGIPTLTARKLVMAGAAVLTMASGLAGLAGSVALAIGMMSLLMFAHGFWITNFVTIISDRFPKGAVGTVMGLAGAVGAVGGMFSSTAIGLVVERFSYGPVWLASGCLYPLALVVLLVTVRGQRKVED